MGRALHFYGVFGKPTAVGACGTYPYVAHRMYLSPQGGGGDDDVTASVPAGATGLRFDLKSTTPGNALVVKLILKSLADYSAANPCASDAYAYHKATVTMPGSGVWAQISMPLSSFVLPSYCTTGQCAPPPTGKGASLASPSLYIGGGLRLMAIQFEATNFAGGATSGSASFDYDIDNLEFY